MYENDFTGLLRKNIFFYQKEEDRLKSTQLFYFVLNNGIKQFVNKLKIVLFSKTCIKKFEIKILKNGV